MWNCLANIRNLLSAHLFQGRELEVRKEQAEGMEEGGRGDKRVSGQAWRHSGCIQQVLQKCLAPSPAEQKAGSRGWRPQQEGQKAGVGGSEGWRLKSGFWWPPAPATPRTTEWDKGPLCGAWHRLAEVGGVVAASPVCCVWGDVGTTCCVSVSL